jgi:hypothetical protein
MVPCISDIDAIKTGASGWILFIIVRTYTILVGKLNWKAGT